MLLGSCLHTVSLFLLILQGSACLVCFNAFVGLHSGSDLVASLAIRSPSVHPLQTHSTTAAKLDIPNSLTLPAMPVSRLLGDESEVESMLSLMQSSASSGPTAYSWSEVSCGFQFEEDSLVADFF